MSQEFHQSLQAANKHSLVTVSFCYIRNHQEKFLCILLFVDQMLFLNNNASWTILSSCFCDLCLHDSCVRKQSSILFFYSFSQSRLWRIILMKFFYQNRCIFLYYHVQFSCFLFIFFLFDQKLKSCEFHVSFHVVNQVNKIQVFFILNDHKL